MDRKKLRWIALLVFVCLFTTMFTACGKDSVSVSAPPPAAEEPAVPVEEKETIPAPTPAASAPAEEVSPVVDQYYLNDKFMIEMLVNDDCVIEEDGVNLMISTKGQKAGIILSLIPGVQNLAAAGELSLAMVKSGFPDAEVSEVKDANLFGAMAKNCTYSYQNEEGTHYGIEAAAIVNQSCYFMNVLLLDGLTDAEGQLVTNVFSSMNVLRPANVDAAAHTATYASNYQQQLDAKTVQPAKSTVAAPVAQWNSLPYEYYYNWDAEGTSAEGAFGYGSYPSWYYEADWDYYSDPGDYWDWGWDSENDWAFYDEYSDYYEYDAYQEEADYWEKYEYDWGSEGTSAEGAWDYAEEYEDMGDYGDYGDPGDYADYEDYGDEW